ncbi:MAG: LptF/LptG family permease [Sedimentisphaerales bacterium]|nr:LptF/LptG family permease [Sedimentisphaerales bacterium]
MKVFILALVALTLILSLGSILQPVQEYGAGPRQVIFLMFYFLPITLTFVLPMAALFAGALVYGRFTSDNEFDACRASGISVLTLVTPGLLLAIIVAIANLILSFYIMPTFVHLAEKSLKADAKQMLFRNIQQKGFYKLAYDNHLFLIYADYADPLSDTLSGVIAVEVKANEIKQIYPIETAKIEFITGENNNEVRITAKNTGRIGRSGEGGAEFVSLTKQFGSILGDDIKFKKIDEMGQIESDFMKFEPIAILARNTYSQLLLELLARDIREKISPAAGPGNTPTEAPGDTGNFYTLVGEPNSVRFFAGQCLPQDEQIDLINRITAVEYQNNSGIVLNTVRGKEAFLSMEMEGDRLSPILKLDIRSVTVQETNQLKMWHIIQGLKPPAKIENIASQFKSGNGSLNVEKLAAGFNEIQGFEPSKRLADLRFSLDKQVKKTKAEIKAEKNSRLVFGIGCVAMILIGIGLGIIKRGGHLLSAFGVSCIPAAILIVCIMSGKQLTENLGAQTISGVAIMWAGLIFLFFLTLGIYYHLLKN